jgi:hypothetical protein
MKPCVFIHTNEKQIIGALVSKYSFERFASDPSSFEVRLVETSNTIISSPTKAASICATG